MEIGVTPITVTLVTHTQNICFETLYSAVLEVLVPEGRMLPQTDSIMISLNLKLRLPSPLWDPYASEAIGKEVSYSAGWGDWSWLPRRNWTTTPQWRLGRLSGIQKILEGVFYYYHALWLISMKNYNNPIHEKLLRAQTLQKLRSGSPHKVKNHDQLRYLLKAKWIESE